MALQIGGQHTGQPTRWDEISAGYGEEIDDSKDIIPGNEPAFKPDCAIGHVVVALLTIS
jgi:hypothetical protein